MRALLSRRSLGALLLAFLLPWRARRSEGAIGAGGGAAGGFKRDAFTQGFNIGSQVRPTTIGWRAR
jgi:hypothetical protein